ncbi:MAG: Hpt domain-containing protein [Burkholderiales bacterium]|nr:Hpt domain-containing protein [Burkholderiales bacterium]
MPTPTIDDPTFAALRDTTGDEFVRELVDTFLAEAPGMFDDLREALARSDAERFRRAAHSLKSNGNTFGALTFGGLARDLEMAGAVEVRGRGAGALAPIEAEYGRVAAALRAWRHE